MPAKLRNFEWSRPAIKDREKIADYYIFVASELLAEEADQAIIDATQNIFAAPLSYREGIKGTREYVMQRFPFTIIYRVTARSIRIVRVLHQARQYFNR